MRRMEPRCLISRRGEQNRAFVAEKPPGLQISEWVGIANGIG
jgi:hypothetical protein